MSTTTTIEWTDTTWNPTTGCTKASPGCDHCYAETLHNRFHGAGSFDTVRLNWDKVTLPLRWRKPRRVFVNSMSDLFHDDVDTELIAKVFAVMALAGQHTFQVLTKRHGRLRSLLRDEHFRAAVDDYAGLLLPDLRPPAQPRHLDLDRGGVVWPIPNVWIGVSVENQQWADIRIPALLDTPAAVRFLSCEPLLGPVDLFRTYRVGNTESHVFPLGHVAHGVHWVIAGGESGPGARPMDVEWAQQLRDQCVAAGVPYFFKQHGAHDEHGRRVGKAKAGRLLDGRTWDEFPQAVTA